MKAGITQQVKPGDSTECYIVTIADTTLSHLTVKSLWKQTRDMQKNESKMMNIYT